MKIGIICPNVPGHLNPASCLAQALTHVERAPRNSKSTDKHEVTIICLPNAAGVVNKPPGVDFHFLGTRDHPELVSEIQDGFAKLGQLQGNAAWEHTIWLFQLATKIMFAELPDLLISGKFDALLIDECYRAAISVAEACKIPFGILCSALPLLPDPLVPPFTTTWQPLPFPILTQLRNWFWNIQNNHKRKAVNQMLEEYGEKNGLPKNRNNDGYYQQAAGFYISQCPEFLDFPRARLPPHFHYTRPWHTLQRDDDKSVTSSSSNAGKKSSFPFHKLNDNIPLVYASMGTLQNGLEQIFLNLAKACQHLDTKVQLVISLGVKGARLASLEDYLSSSSSQNTTAKNDIIVVDYCPQLQVLERASVMVTHAGQNTALEGLAVAGIPMVTIPVTNDQPGVAARWVRAGVAQLVTPNQATVPNLKTALNKVLMDPIYRQRAQEFQRRLQSTSLAQVAELVGIALDEITVTKTITKTKHGEEDNDDGTSTTTRHFLRTHPAAIRILGNSSSSMDDSDDDSHSKPTFGSSSLFFLCWKNTTTVVATVAVISTILVFQKRNRLY